MKEPSVKTGDRVTIIHQGRRYPAVLMLASDNEESLMLSFEAIIDGHVGMMPVLKEDGVYRSIMTGIEIEVIPCP